MYRFISVVRCFRWLSLPAALLVMAGADPSTPLPRTNKPGWMDRHEAKLREIRQPGVNLIFLGDSITQELERNGPVWGDENAIWQRFYACRHAVNLGFGGDTTSSVLWRIENGEIGGIHPALAVVMIGTNNLAPAQGQAPDAIAGGIVTLVAALHQRLPATRILLLGVPPSGRDAATEAKRRQVNALLQSHAWADQPVTFMSIDSVFERNDVLDTSLYLKPRNNGPMLHPNEDGWERLAEAIEPRISSLSGGSKPCAPEGTGAATH